MASGIFLISELEGALRDRIHAVQRRFDPKLANFLPPHITITGSSGVGPIAPEVDVERLRAALEPVVASTPPIIAGVRPPMRFMQSNTVVLPLDPHGALRALHDRITTCGLPFAPSRHFFTPHVTLNLYATLTPERLRELLTVTLEQPIVIERVQAYLSNDPMPPVRMLELELGAARRD